MQRSALCRSRRELSNDYLLAKIGVDTAENEPCKVCPLSADRSPRLAAGLLDRCEDLEAEAYVTKSALVQAKRTQAKGNRCSRTAVSSLLNDHENLSEARLSPKR